MRHDTLLLVTSSSVFRIDRVDTSTPTVAASLPRSPGEMLAESVGMMLRSDKERLGRVWIAATDAWVGDVEVERRVLHAVGDEGIEETLAIEAEGLSGIAAFSSRLAALPQTIAAVSLKSAVPLLSGAAMPSIDGPRNASFQPAANSANFLVLQIDENEYASIEMEVQDRRGKLMGIGSAAITTPPPPQGPAGAASTQTIACELETGTVLACHLGETTVTWMLPGRFHSSDVRRDYSHTLGDALDPSRVTAFVASLQNGSGQVSSEVGDQTTDASLHSWDDPSAVLRWAALWHTAVTRARSNALLIAPIKAPVSNAVWTFVAIAAAVITAIACLVWQVRAANEVDRLAAEAEVLRQEKAQPNQIQRNIDTLKEDLRKITTENSEREQRIFVAEKRSRWVAARLRLRQQRWQTLVEAIATSVGDQCVIESLAWTSQELKIEGHCATAAAAHQTADRLARQIGDAGWQVDPAQTEFGDNQLYSFRLAARPTDAPTQDPANTDLVAIVGNGADSPATTSTRDQP